MLMLVIFIFGMASVCASDVNDMLIADEDDSTVELLQAGTDEIMSNGENELFGQTENDELISEGNIGTFAELQANITAAAKGSTLTLDKNYEYKGGFDTEEILINKSITIDGNGFKIDAQEKSRIFKITADNVVLKNIIFANGKTTENGGAVFFEKSGAVTNCNFTNNFDGSGAVFFVGKGEVTYCNFFDNYATYGGAIYFSSIGAVSNCNFTYNTATENGGAVYFQNNGDVRNCNFINSISKNNGGVIFFEKSATVTNCNFNDNTASNTGGAVYCSSDGEVTNCNFTNNKATGEKSLGGAVYFSSTSNVTNCNFTNNTAKMGNAIYINSNHATISDCDFTNNPITKGAIHSATGDITLSNNILNVDDVVKGRNFTEIQKLIDRANDGDEITIDGLYAGFGIPIRITKSLTLIGQNNATLDAKKLSKILHITANNVIIKNIEFTKGYAEDEGAVYFYRTATVINCNFTNNEVTGDGSSGGAIYFNGAGNVINSIFTDNKATKNGGAIYVEAQSINNNFSSQFYNNYAGQSGGAIFFHNLVQNNTFDCIFKDNYAGYGGGMFFSRNTNSNRFNSNFINNTAKSCGGAMFFYSTTDKNEFAGSFINNRALGQIDPTNGNGGAITFKNVSTNSIFACDFINNTASLNGGAVNYRETPQHIKFNSNFINNTAQRGGGVNFFKTFEDVIFNGEFIGNSAEDGGALAAGYGTIEDISFKNNHANRGGAVYLAGSGSTVNCNFTNNTATYGGGAVYISEKCNVVNCSFENNSAVRNGGAVLSKFGTVENSNFTDNAAKNDGGAVCLNYPSNVANCHFANNSAKNGGAVYFLNDNDNVINCTFVANEATNRGGAVFFMTNQQVNLTNCYFGSNSAPEGGAIFCYRWAVTADSCILKTDSDTTNNTLFLSPSLTVYDFYSVYGSGEKLTFNLTTNSGMPITNGNISMTIYCKDNDRGAINYTCLSGEGWIVDLPVGYYYAVINTEFKDFERIIRTIEITMPDVRYYINVTSITTNNTNVNLTAKSNIPKNLLWDAKLLFILPNGKNITANYADNGIWWAEHTFDASGVYQVNATYVGLDNVIINNANISISKTPTEITVENTTVNLFVRDSVASGAVLTPADAGNLTFTSSNESIAKVENGKIIAVSEGTAVITVSFAGNNDYETAENKTINVTVSKIATNIAVEPKSLDLKVGDESGIIATLNPADAGNLTFVSSDDHVVTVDDNGNVKAIGVGSANVTVSFTGNDKYAAAESQTVAVSVSKIPTNIDVKDVKVDLNVGDSKNAGASLTPADAGQLKYKSSNPKVVKVEDGKLVAVAEGTATITVRFEGNDKYEASKDKTISVTVSLKDASVIADQDSLELCVGESGEFYVETTPEDLDISVSSSNESVATVKLVNRVPTVTAVGEGSAIITVTINEKDYVKNSTTVAVTVTKIPTSISANVDSELAVGDNSKINYTLTPSDATGKVSFKSSNLEVLTVDAKGNVKAVGEGSATITVSYAGDDKYTPSNTTVGVKVSKSEIGPEIKQNGTTLTVTVPEYATGDITVTIGNKTIKAPIKDGKVVIDLSDVPAGDYNLTVSYSGDDKYSGFDVVVPVSIGSEFQLIAENLTKYYHGTERFAVKVVDGKGNHISGAEVKIFLNGVTYTRITDENGSASIGVNLESGEYIATVSCNNTTVEATITVLTTVNGTDLVKVFRNATQYFATFRDSEGNYLKDGTTVRFNIHGVFYDRTVSGGKGLAKLNINLEQGEYIITAINLETGESRANNITVIPRIIENYDLTKYYRNASQYTVKLIGDDGKAVGAGEEVTFNINGVFYTRTTNASGIAKLNINLQPGDYIITAGYKNCVVSNNIKVLPVLTAQDLTKKYGTKDQFTASLVDGQGKAYAGQSVQFNINGVFYNRVTDTNGQAKLNINLQPGEYIITSSYNGASIANKVTVTA